MIDTLVDTCPILTYDVTSKSSDVVNTCHTADLSVGCRTITFPVDAPRTHTATYSVTTAGGKVSTFSLVFEVDCAITNVIITQDTSVNVLLKEDGSNFVADANGNIIFEVPKASV